MKEEKVDRVMRDYFEHEMRPWPKPPETELTIASRSVGSLASSRLLVGMSLVAVVLVYLGVATLFPRPTSGGLQPNQHPQIGHKAKIVRAP